MKNILDNITYMAMSVVVNGILEKHLSKLEHITTKLGISTFLTKWYWIWRLQRYMKLVEKDLEDCKKLKQELESV